jgi:hypothetical protein
MSRKRNPETDLIVSPTGTPVVPPRRKANSKTRVKHSAASAEFPVREPEVSVPEVSVSEPPAIATEYQPTYEEISHLAYQYWEGRGCQGGSPEEDWLRAEQELRFRSRAVTV